MIAEDLLALTNDADIIGGAPLLGINGVAMVMHGRIHVTQFASGIAHVKDIFQRSVVECINAELLKIGRKRENAAG